MLHHLGLVMGAAGLCGTLLMFGACTTQSSAGVRPIAMTETQIAASSVEDAARVYLTNFYAHDSVAVRRALSVTTGSASLNDAAVTENVADNRAHALPKEVVVVRKENLSALSEVDAVSMWFVLVRAEATTRQGYLIGRQQRSGRWAFSWAS